VRSELSSKLLVESKVLGRSNLANYRVPNSPFHVPDHVPSPGSCTADNASLLCCCASPLALRCCLLCSLLGWRRKKAASLGAEGSLRGTSCRGRSFRGFRLAAVVICVSEKTEPSSLNSLGLVVREVRCFPDLVPRLRDMDRHFPARPSPGIPPG